MCAGPRREWPATGARVWCQSPRVGEPSALTVPRRFAGAAVSAPQPTQALYVWARSWRNSKRPARRGGTWCIDEGGREVADAAPTERTASSVGGYCSYGYCSYGSGFHRIREFAA